MSGIQQFNGNAFVGNEYEQAQQSQQSQQHPQHYPVTDPSHQSHPVQHQPSFEHLTATVSHQVPQQVYLQQGAVNHYQNGIPPGAQYPPNAIAGPSYSHPAFIPGQIPMPQENYHFASHMTPALHTWNGNPPWEDMDGDYRDGNEVIYGSLEVSSNSASTPQNLNRDPDRLPSVPPPSSSRMCGLRRSSRSPFGPNRTIVPEELDLNNLNTLLNQSDEDAFKVKHRRRTTPEQLKVLEHWFDVNPKPDNNLREWLAHELGMTKRNVQVWFQNRRAKVKGVALKEKAAQAKASQDGQAEPVKTPEGKSTTPPNSAPPAHNDPRLITSPERQDQLSFQQQVNREPAHFAHVQRPPPLSIHSQPQIGLLPPVNGVNMGRRASLANGEAAKIETFLAKQRMAARKASTGTAHNMARQSGFVSPIRSPIIPQNQASSARRGSIPYPSPIEVNGLSPKISPSVRTMSSALHLAALRNNSRRSSVPGAPQVQLISSGPFTPPRVVSSGHPGGLAGGEHIARGLSPIKDQDGDHPQVEGQLSQQQQQDGTYVYSEADLSTTYLTPPSSTYLPNTSPASYMHPDTSSTTYDFGFDQSQQPFTPAGPLPNPSFSFGSASSMHPQVQMDDPNSSYNMWMAMQNRGRLSSITSINTYTTDGAPNGDMSDWGSEFAGLSGGVDMDGFDPDARRASAPADLLHDLGVLGINSNMTIPKSATPLRPSPLGANFTQGDYQSLGMNQTYSNNSNGEAFLVSHGQNVDFSNPGSDDSPSNSSSEGHSPSAHLNQAQMQNSHDGKQQLSLSTMNLHPPPLYPESMSGGSGSTSVSPFSSSISTSNGFLQPNGLNAWHSMDNNNGGVTDHTGGNPGMNGIFGMDHHSNMSSLSGESVRLEDANKEEFAFFADLSGDPVNVLV